MMRVEEISNFRFEISDDGDSIFDAAVESLRWREEQAPPLRKNLGIAIAIVGLWAGGRAEKRRLAAGVTGRNFKFLI